MAASRNAAVSDPWSQDPWRVRTTTEGNAGLGSSANVTTSTVTPVWPPMSSSFTSTMQNSTRNEESSRYSLDAPSWDGRSPEVSIEPYLKSLRGWLVTTKTPKQQQGLILLNAAKDDLKLIINELTLDELTDTNGGERIYQLVQSTFDWALKRTLPRKLESCLYGSSGERQRGEGFLAYTARKLQQYRELETSGLTLPSQVKGYIMAKHGRLTNSQWETMTSWTSGSLELSTVSDALCRMDRPAGIGSMHGASKEVSAIALFQHEDDGDWPEEVLNDDAECALEGLEEPLQVYHMSGIAREQLLWDQGDAQVVYAPAYLAETKELTEDQAVAVYANYQQIRAQLHGNALGRGYYDRQNYGKGCAGKSNKGFADREQKGKKGASKGSYQAYPFRTRLSELIARTKCARCGERGHWARSCTQPPRNQNAFWTHLDSASDAPFFIAYSCDPEDQKEDAPLLSSGYPHIDHGFLSSDVFHMGAEYAIDNGFLSSDVFHTGAEYLPNDVFHMSAAYAYPVLDKFVGLQMTSNLALIDTGAESGVMGSKARERLVCELAKYGLTPQRVPAARTSASGVGGKVIVEEVLQFPIGVAGHRGTLKAAVLPDPEVPVLLPANMLLQLGAVLNLPERTIHWTRLGDGAKQSVKILPSGHMAIDILDFGVGKDMPSPNIFAQNTMDTYAAALKPSPSSLEQNTMDTYTVALKELTEQRCPHSTLTCSHYWQENGVTVLDANLPEKLKEALKTTVAKVLPLADSNRPFIQNHSQSVRSLTLGCYTRRGFGITQASKQEEWRALLMSAHEAAKRQPKSIHQAYLAVTITEGAVATHRDQNNEGNTNLLVVGDYVGGGLVIQQKTWNVCNCWTHFNPQGEHSVEPYTGFRRSFAFYTPRHTHRLTKEDWTQLTLLGFPVQQYLCQFKTSLPPGLCGKKARLGKRERQKKREYVCAESAQAVDSLGGGPPLQGRHEPSQPCSEAPSGTNHPSQCRSSRDTDKGVSMVCASMAPNCSPVANANGNSFNAACVEVCVASKHSEGHLAASQTPEQRTSWRKQRIQPCHWWRSSGSSPPDELHRTTPSDCRLHSPHLQDETQSKQKFHMVDVSGMRPALEQVPLPNTHGQWRGSPMAREICGLAVSAHSEGAAHVCALGGEREGEESKHGRELAEVCGLGGRANQPLHRPSGPGSAVSQCSLINDAAIESTPAPSSGKQFISSRSEQQQSVGMCGPRRGRAGEPETCQSDRGWNPRCCDGSIASDGEQRGRVVKTTWSTQDGLTLEGSPVLWQEDGTLRTMPRKVRRNLLNALNTSWSTNGGGQLETSMGVWPVEEHVLDEQDDAEEPSEEEWTPSSQQLRDIQIAHDNCGHPAPQRFAQLLRLGGAPKQLVRYVLRTWRCPTCTARQRPQARPPAASMITTEPNHTVGIDLVELQNPVEGGTDYWLNVCCWATNYMQVKRIINKEPITVLTAFLDTWVRWLGWPKVIVNDQGSEFAGAFGEYISQHGCLALVTDARAPWQNSKTERLGGEWKEQMSNLLHEWQPVSNAEWDDMGVMAVLARNQCIDRTGYSPQQRLLGVGHRLPLSLSGLTNDDVDPEFLWQGPRDDVRRREELRQAAWKSLIELQSRERVLRASRAQHRVPLQELQPGDLVMIWRQPGHQRGAWHGPGTVVMTQGQHIWCSVRGNVWKVNRTHLRLATNMEHQGQELLQKYLQTVTEELRGSQRGPKRYLDSTSEPSPPEQQ
eukprot:3784927-Amphidinium_carterae.1